VGVGLEGRERRERGGGCKSCVRRKGYLGILFITQETELSGLMWRRTMPMSDPKLNTILSNKICLSITKTYQEKETLGHWTLKK
jgi:hypothetical protein